MKKILIGLFVLFTGVAVAETITVNWYNGDTVYDTTTCNAGDDLILPTAPTKRGHTFMGWLIYTPIEYLESTGTQYINTGQNFMYGDEFFFDYMPVAIYTSDNKGYGTGGSNEIVGGGVAGSTSVGYIVQMIIGGTRANYSPALLYSDSLLRRYTENWIMDSGTLNSTLTDVKTGRIYTLTKDNFSASYVSGSAIYFFRASGSYPGSSRLRLYGTRLKRANGTYAFNMVPALDLDGVPCMYDKVSNTYFYNQGTGDFIAGPIIAE